MLCAKFNETVSNVFRICLLLTWAIWLPTTKKNRLTLWCGLMVNPVMINGGDHSTFISGNDANAKEEVKTILKSFGWNEKNILDLGDITAARGTEMYLPLWLRIYGASKS